MISARIPSHDISKTRRAFLLLLAICKAIVDAQGGSIVAGSKPGEGSSFIVRRPA